MVGAGTVGAGAKANGFAVVGCAALLCVLVLWVLLLLVGGLLVGVLTGCGCWLCCAVVVVGAGAVCLVVGAAALSWLVPVAFSVVGDCPGVGLAPVVGECLVVGSVALLLSLGAAGVCAVVVGGAALGWLLLVLLVLVLVLRVLL